ncbi:MAG TPA: YidB family protein [Hyphomicrobiaceae bacterium]|nr:YidB family protein [Hyphomicrobiaceae bacterium]
MSWSDALKSSLGDILGQAEATALPALMNRLLGADALQSMLAKLQEQGLGEHVQSWLDENRQNIPVSAEQLRQALGNEHVQQLAASAGIPVDKVLAVIAQYLPQAAAGGAAAAAEAGDDSTSR